MYMALINACVWWPRQFWKHYRMTSACELLICKFNSQTRDLNMSWLCVWVCVCVVGVQKGWQIRYAVRVFACVWCWWGGSVSKRSRISEHQGVQIHTQTHFLLFRHTHTHTWYFHTTFTLVLVSSDKPLAQLLPGSPTGQKKRRGEK